jgi:hypothetical protein
VQKFFVAKWNGAVSFLIFTVYRAFEAFLIMAKHHPDLIFCRKQAVAAIGKNYFFKTNL